MADNSTIPATGDVYASDDIGGVKHFRVKIEHGADGAAGDASTANPLPVVQTGALPAGTAAIGKLAANAGVNIGTTDVNSSALPTGAATETSVAALLATMLSDNAGFTDGTSKVQPSGYIYDEVAGTALTENDVVAARADVKRAQVHVLEDETTRGQRQTVYSSKAAKVAASQESSTLLAAGAELTPKRAFVNLAASQTQTVLVAAVTSKVLRVVQVAAVAGGTATNLTFNSNTTAISPLFANGANGGIVLPFSQVGWFQTASGEGLTVTSGAGSTTGIIVSYIEV